MGAPLPPPEGTYHLGYGALETGYARDIRPKISQNKKRSFDLYLT